MRYYKIIVRDPKTGVVYTPPGFTAELLGNASYSSYVNGKTLPEAWNVELDIPAIDAGTSQGFAMLRVWGISLAEIAQAKDLTNKNIEVYGGMQAGLPLANPKQSGLLISGMILQCFGNWIGTAMTLDFVITPAAATAVNINGLGTQKAPRNLTLNWQGGQPLGPALEACLKTGFPGYTVKVTISDKIVRPQDDNQLGIYSTLGQLAQEVGVRSRSIVGTPIYPGVSIVANGTTISAFDALQGNTTQIGFNDLIGQPTWIESPNISVKTVMRADLAVWSKIKLPQTIVTNTQQANSNLLNQRANFQGAFYIVSLRHIGNFRQPSADAWVTVIEAAPENPQ